jgi:hypothetical protein
MKIVLVASTKLPNNSETLRKRPSFVIGLFFQCTFTLDAEKSAKNVHVEAYFVGFLRQKTWMFVEG